MSTRFAGRCRNGALQVGLLGFLLGGLDAAVAAREPAASTPASGPFAALIEAPYLGVTFSYSGPPNASRFLAARLIVVNRSSRPLVVMPRDIVLRVERSEVRLKEVPLALRSHSFQAGNQSIELGKIKPLTDLTVGSGKTAGKWIAFTGLPAGIQVPNMVVSVRLPEETIEINVNESARRSMGLSTERIGPRGCLALLTISGDLNTVSIGSLTGVLESMVTQKVVRAVVRFTESAPPLEGQVLSWLQQGAYLAGRGENNNQQMPVIPSTLRELHLAAIPNRSAANLDGSSGLQPRIHKTDAEAVRAALKSAIEVLPRDELLLEIEKGHPLSRLAALADGGGRLAVDDLPLVLRYVDDSDPQMQRAALTALRHFGEKAAIEKLLEYARRDQEPTASVAIESLAASRYAVAHQALLDILKNEHPASRRLIVRVLARFPRPLWSDTILSFVTDPEPQVAIEALRALVQTGHPRLFDVLKDALARGTGPVRDEAFQLLASRSDRRSEELALDYALRTMKDGPPASSMYALLNRTKDARAIPLLLAELDRSSSSRAQIISTLGQIGDQSVADVLARKYSEFADRDKTAMLNALLALKSPHFRRLAGEAILQKDSSLVHAAVVGLQTDGSPQAVQLLVRSLELSDNPTVWSYVTSALGNFGTPEAKTALQKARESENTSKHAMAIAALRNITMRSPGYPYYLQARQSAQSERWDEAISRYTSAIELDAELGDAYSGRGHSLLQKKKWSQAHKDFTKAVELEPYSSEAVTGLGICLVQEGRIDEGIKVVEGSRSRMSDDPIYTYNAACVYGRALERQLKHDPAGEGASDKRAAEKRAAEYRAKAIADLRRSIKLGFAEFDWMKKDPDLDSLHGVTEFEKLVNPEGTAEENRTPGDNSHDDAGGGGGGKTKPGKSKGRPGGNRGNANRGIPNRGGAASTDSLPTEFLFENARP